MYKDKYYTNITMWKCFFCGEIITPFIIEESGYIIYDDVCEQCIIYFEEEKYDYKIPDDILYDNFGLDLKFVYEDYIENENTLGTNWWEK